MSMWSIGEDQNLAIGEVEASTKIPVSPAAQPQDLDAEKLAESQQEQGKQDMAFCSHYGCKHVTGPDVEPCHRHQNCKESTEMTESECNCVLIHEQN